MAFPILGMLIKDSEKKDSKGLKTIFFISAGSFLKKNQSASLRPTLGFETISDN